MLKEKSIIGGFLHRDCAQDRQISILLRSMATIDKKQDTKGCLGTKAGPSKELVVKYMSLAIDNSPKQIQPFMKKATPFVLKLVEFIECLIPIVLELYAKAHAFWISIQP
jgi:hypothetical protein